MNRLVRADLKRIVKRPGLYVVVIIMVLIVLLKGPEDTASAQIEFYKMLFSNIGLTFLLIPIFLYVYTDEVKSGIMISVIGMGMPRKRIVKSKLQDSFLLLFGAYMVLYCAALWSNNSMSLVINPRQNMFLLLFCLFCVIRGIGIMALASLVLFLTMSATGGMLVLILVGISSSGVLQAMQDYMGLPVYDYSYIGLLDASYAGMQAGDLGEAIIPALLYLFAVIAINIVTFDKKEMDL